MEISVEGNITREDFAEAYAYLQQKVGKKFKNIEPPFFGFFHMLVIGLIIGIGLNALRHFGIFSFHLEPITAAVVLVLFVFVILFLIPLYRTVPKNLPLDNGSILGHHKYMVDEKGFTEETKAFNCLTHWKGIKAVEETQNQIYIFIDTHYAHFIPKRFFPSDYVLREFTETLRKNMKEGETLI
jgi:hypothetical protein